MVDVLIGVDVGTGSARAGVFSLDGEKLASATQSITTWRPRSDFAQQSSSEIWAAVCACVRQALSQLSDVQVVGVGFDATCSLVVIGADGQGLSVDPEGAPGQDVILWSDHRALSEADEINAGRYDVLRYVGGTISPEMETPKLLWLKRELPETYTRAKLFFDLPDFLTWRATGSESRSACSTACKWTYLAHEGQWDVDYFRGIGLDDLVDDGFARIGRDIRPLGGVVGRGLTEAAARELGLKPGTPVGVSAIDAHAGGIGVLGAAEASQFDAVLALICGTSSCHMAVSSRARFVAGVWGPYADAMLPGMWLNEAGQSAVGSLVDFIVESHAAGPALTEQARLEKRSVFALLNERLATLEGDRTPGEIAASLHVLADFHGNRSPYADPALRGGIDGLTLSATQDDLVRLYLASLQGLAYGTRDIIEALNAEGYRIDTLLATGGWTKNPVFLREHANATGCRILLPKEPDSVLLGAAILGAVASGAFPDLATAMKAMSRPGDEITPDSRTYDFHAAKRGISQDMRRRQLQYRARMEACARA